MCCDTEKKACPKLMITRWAVVVLPRDLPLTEPASASHLHTLAFVETLFYLYLQVFFLNFPQAEGHLHGATLDHPREISSRQSRIKMVPQVQANPCCCSDHLLVCNKPLQNTKQQCYYFLWFPVLRDSAGCSSAHSRAYRHLHFGSS